jgi:hypothetical protein
MATTSAGNPYVESSDLVANYPATSLALANRLDKYAVNPFADAAARDAAIPTPVQGQLAQTLDDNKVWRYDGTAWAPFSGAVSAANFTDTATGTYTDSSGQSWKFLNFSGTSSVTIDQAGFCDLLIVGGGASGGSGYAGGGGAGALLYIEDAYLSATTHVVTVGAGGPGVPVVAANTGVPGTNGNASRIADYLSPGGGSGGGGSGFANVAGGNGGSGGGASGAEYGAFLGAAGGTGTLGLGGHGGNGPAGIGKAGAGGGGAAAGSLGIGGSPTIAGYGASGAAGATTTIRNTVVTLCAGGGGSGLSGQGSGGSGIGGMGGSGVGGAATGGTGSGGGGAYTITVGSSGGNGGSGTITIRVKV